MSSSELCNACNIFNICHEPQKTVAKACQHFKGDLPEGYVYYRYSAALFVRKRGFAANIGYLDLPSGKHWLEQWEIDRLRREGKPYEARRR